MELRVEQSTFNHLRKLPWVMAYLGVSKTTVYRLVNANKFPKPIKTGSRSIAWREGDVVRWVEERASDMDGE